MGCHNANYCITTKISNQLVSFVKMNSRQKKYFLFITIFLLIAITIWILSRTNTTALNPKVSNKLSGIYMDSLLLEGPKKAEVTLNKFKNTNFEDLTKEERTTFSTYKIIIFLEKNELDSIPYYTNEALNNAAEIKDDRIQSRLYYTLGSYYRLIGDYSKSLEYSLKGLSFTTVNSKEKVDLYNNLGGIYFELDDYDLALDYLQKSYQGATSLKDIKRTAVGYANIGNVYLLTENYIPAKNNLRHSCLYFEKVNDTVNIIKSLTSISKIELMQNNFAAALSYLDQAKDLSLNTEVNVQLALVYQHYGNAYGGKKEYQTAIDYYNKAYKLSDENQIARDKMNALDGLARNYNKLQKFKQANESLNQYYHLKDSIYGVKVRQKIEELKWSTVINDQKLKNELLYKEVETERLNKSNLTKTYIIIIVIILLIVVFLWMLYKNNKKSLQIANLSNDLLTDKITADTNLKLIQEVQFQQELETRNKELISLNILILAKNKIFNDIDSIIEYGGRNFEETLFQLKNIIKSNRNQENDWEKFKNVFETVHPDFFKTIKDKFPQLSKTEIRVCTYIKMNMPSTEICEMLNINQNSLNKGRYRIRKKLDLLGTEDLDEFVKSW